MPKYIIYGKAGCKPCEDAKGLLTRENEQFTYIDISTDMAAKTKILNAGFMSVPQIYFGDTYIGGYGDLLKTFK